MLIVLAGGVLAVLGLLCAALLVAVPLGLVAVPASLLPWVLFPLFTLVGYVLLAVGSDDPAARLPTKALSGALLILALVAAVALVAGATGLAHAGAGAGASLWFVLAVGGTLGAVGSAATARRRLVG